MMLKKRCLFCDEIVPAKLEGSSIKFMNCSCSPEGSYMLHEESYAAIQAMPLPIKRNAFHLLSAYIREHTDCGEKVELSASDVDSIANAPTLPVTVQEKGNRLLQYLYRHARQPEDPVFIHPLNRNYNLTYSPNLQELVYIIDKLSGEQLLVREGTTFKLTAAGWNEAAAAAKGSNLKPCSVLISGDETTSRLWEENMLPVIEQAGYLPRLLAHTGQQTEKYSLDLISDSRLLIVDLSGEAQEVLLAGGYALGLGIPVIWTVNSLKANELSLQIQDIRPVVWDTPEDLAAILRQIQ